MTRRDAYSLTDKSGAVVTIVAAVSSQFHAVILADSRLAQGIDADGRTQIAQDICQKLLPVNYWSLVGFAGQFCLARHLAYETVGRLQQHIAPDWLRSDAAVAEHFRFLVRHHSRRWGSDHYQCGEARVEILIVWMDHSHSIVRGDHQPGDELWHPGVEIIRVSSPPVVVQRTKVGIEVIGSGAVIAPKLQQSFLQLINGGSGATGGYALAMGARRLLERHNLATVGGLYQMATIGPHGPGLWGVEWVPYFYWADVEPGYGTYVAMRFENGAWVQEHRPTGRRVRVARPDEIHLDGVRLTVGQNQMFNPIDELTRDSPGVIEGQLPQMVFAPYDPANVPMPVRESWGNAPLTPMTFGAPRNQEAQRPPIQVFGPRSRKS